MSQSLAKILIHLVFSTKNRQPVIIPSVQPHLCAYLAGTCRNLGAECLPACIALSGLSSPPHRTPGRCPGLIC